MLIYVLNYVPYLGVVEHEDIGRIDQNIGEMVGRQGQLGYAHSYC